MASWAWVAWAHASLRGSGCSRTQKRPKALLVERVRLSVRLQASIGQLRSHSSPFDVYIDQASTSPAVNMRSISWRVRRVAAESKLRHAAEREVALNRHLTSTPDLGLRYDFFGLPALCEFTMQQSDLGLVEHW